MKLDVQIEKHELQVTCKIEVTQASYTFALSYILMKKYQFTNLEKGILVFRIMALSRDIISIYKRKFFISECTMAGTQLALML